MARFRCRVVDDKGRIIEEIFAGENKSRLAESFISKGYRIISIEEKKDNILQLDIGRGRINKKDLILFCRQMSTLLKSGIPLINSLDITASQSDDRLFKGIMDKMSAEIRTGCSLSEAMSRQTGQFPEMLCKMIEVGEVTGDINSMFERMAVQFEGESKIERKVRSALTYPVTLLFVALIACIFMLTFIVPQFADMFDQLGSELPASTRILVGISNFITQKWYVMLMILSLTAAAISRMLSQEKIRYRIDEKKLKIKMLKGPMQKLMASKLARTMNTLIACGVPITQTLEYAKKNAGNRYAAECIEKIIVGVKQGKGISVQMSQFDIFPKLLVSMIGIGESSGNLEEMLKKTADYFDEETDAAISQLTQLIEPVMLILIGLLIGAIVIALYAPMFGMVDAMQSAI